MDVSPIWASSALTKSILGIKYTESEEALNKFKNNSLQENKDGLQIMAWKQLKV